MQRRPTAAQRIVPEGDSSKRGPSLTALGAARLRAAHLIIDEPPCIFDDPLALRLLDPEQARTIRDDADRLRSPVYRALRCDVLVRSRYTEDRLGDAVRRGVDQYVILGAGLDTFAYRQPAWASGLRIFEVDHGASQLDKRARLSRAGIELPSNVGYAAADLELEALTPALVVAGFDETRPAFVACLGVLIYLSQGAADAIFAMAGRLPAGSEFVFEFSRSEGLPSDLPSPGSAAAHVAAEGEPWRTRFELNALATRLRAAGFGSVRFLFAEDLTERYLYGRNDGLRAPSRVVLADAMI